MPKQTEKLEELTDDDRLNLLRGRLLNVPKDKPVRLYLKERALGFYQWRSLKLDKKGRVDEGGVVIYPEILIAVVSSMDDISEKATPPTHPHRPDIKVKREDYFRRLSSPYEMIGYLSPCCSVGDFVLHPHPDFNSTRSNSPGININAIKSFEVL